MVLDPWSPVAFPSCRLGSRLPFLILLHRSRPPFQPNSGLWARDLSGLSPLISIANTIIGNEITQENHSKIGVRGNPIWLRAFRNTAAARSHILTTIEPFVPVDP